MIASLSTGTGRVSEIEAVAVGTYWRVHLDSRTLKDKEGFLNAVMPPSGVPKDDPSVIFNLI